MNVVQFFGVIDWLAVMACAMLIHAAMIVVCNMVGEAKA